MPPYLPAILLLIAALGLFGSFRRIVLQRRVRFRKLMERNGFHSIGKSLPEGFPPQSNAWQPKVSVYQCFAGRFNGFETAVFSVVIGAGESPLSRSLVAAKRPPFTPKLSPFVAGVVAIDVASTPGWVLASMPGLAPRAEMVQALLLALTA